MKDVEKLLHEALDKHEMPFDPKAWEKMSARLDAKVSSPFYKKWWVAASVGIVAVSAATYYMLHSSENMPKVAAPIKSEVVRTDESKKSNESIGAASESISSTKHTDIVHISSNDNTPKEHATPATTGLNQTNQTNSSAGNPFVSQPFTPTSEQGPVKKTSTAISEEHKALVLPDHVCLNDELQLNNPYQTRTLRVQLPNSETITIAPQTTATFTASSMGSVEVYVGNSLNQSIPVVQPKGKLSLEVDPSIIYDKGIPAIEFTVTGADKNVTWETGKVPFSLEKNTIIVHPYTTQTVTVKVSSVDENGCAVEEIRTIRLDEKYNLLTPNAFVLESTDERNKTFMPFALYERKTPFDLYIYDPKSGRVIFSSNDVNNPWNGFDKSANEMVPVGSTWLWKVVLHKPNPGEPSEYKGTIQRL